MANLEDKLNSMSHDECMNYIRSGVSSTFGMLPKKYIKSINALLDRLDSDYKTMKDERDSAMAELAVLKEKTEA